MARVGLYTYGNGKMTPRGKRVPGIGSILGGIHLATKIFGLAAVPIPITRWTARNIEPCPGNNGEATALAGGLR
jgi:hypothetical protein